MSEKGKNTTLSPILKKRRVEKVLCYVLVHLIYSVEKDECMARHVVSVQFNEWLFLKQKLHIN